MVPCSSVRIAWVRALPLLCAVALLAPIGASHAQRPPLTAVVDDSFSEDPAERYETTGYARSAGGLVLGPRSGIVKRLDCESAFTLSFDLAEQEQADGEWKNQLTLKFAGEHSVSMQIISSNARTKLLLFELPEGNEPRRLREFEISDQLIGRWSLGFHLGHVAVRHDGRVVGETAVDPSDTPITSVLLASVRGRAKVGRLLIECQQGRRPLSLEDTNLLSEANSNASNAQEQALYSRYAEAANSMASAVSTYERLLGESAFRTTWARGALGSYLSHLGRYAQARPMLEKSLNDFANLLGDEHPYTASAQLMLANLLIGIDDAQQGMPLAERALQTARRVYGDRSPTVAAALSSYAAALQALGDYGSAADALAMAVQVREAYFGVNDPHSLRYLLQLADLQMRAGRMEAARADLQRALRILSASKEANPEEELRVRRTLATIDLEGQDYVAAANTLVALLPKVRVQFGTSHRNVALVLHDLSIALLAQGDLDGARKAIDEAAGIQLEAAIDVIGASSEVEALGFMREVFGVQDQLLSTDLVDERTTAAERYRRIAPLRGIYTRVQLLTSGGQTRAFPEEGQAALRELRDVQSMLSGFATYSGPMQNDSRIFAVLDVVTKQKEVLQRRLAAIARQRASVPDGVPDALSRVAKSLPHGTALVDLMKVRVWRPKDGPTRKLSRTWEYHAFVFTRSPSGEVTSETVRLGQAEEIDSQAVTWKQLLSAAKSTPAQSSDRLSASKRLFELIWIPITARAYGAKEIVVIPDGAFSAFPWAALQDPVSGRYVVEDGYAVATSLSVEHVAQLLSTQGPTSRGGALLVGDLDYGKASATNARGIFVGGVNILESGKWGALAGAKREIDAINRIRRDGAKNVILRGKAATERATVAAMRDARFVHFATHGYFAADPLLPDEAEAGETAMAGRPTSGFRVRSSRNPLLRSGLILSGANETGKFEPGTIRIADGVLTAEELSWLDLSEVEMVVLSACETALGSVFRGEGSFGLERAFLLAGARSVVDSLWKVDDATTAALMKRFYELLWGKRLSKLAALREAQLYVLRGGVSAASSPNSTTLKQSTDVRAARGKGEPYYWAAFTMAGDWR